MKSGGSQSWQQHSEMNVWIFSTLVIIQIEAKLIRRCDNINENSVRGAAASTQCPDCEEYLQSKKVTIN